MADVFFSYKSEDRGVVEDIVRALEAEGLSVWWDQGIAPTSDWRSEIHKQLMAAKVVVVAWSKASTDLDSGKWVVQEAEEAERTGRLVPVLIDPVLPPLGLRHIQAIDLLDWHGEQEDPRWRNLRDTIVARLEGRSVAINSPENNLAATAMSLLKGREALLLLVLGLAAIVISVGASFGLSVSLGIVVGLVLAYFSLNTLLQRRRGERAAATFLRRAFAVSRVTIAANILVWTTAIAAGAWPLAKPAIFPDLSVAVYDELKTPIEQAQVSLSLGDKFVRLPLDENGVARVSYPLWWGPLEGVLTVRHNDYEATRPFVRGVGQRFEDLAIGVPSGVERLRISHLTLNELAIDALLQGDFPQGLAEAFPRIAGVVRNAVWDEASTYVALFDTLQSAGGMIIPPEAQEGDVSSIPSFDFQASYSGVRWPQYVLATFPADFSSGIDGCPVDTPLDGHYRLHLANSDGYIAAHSFGPDLNSTDATKLAVSSAGGELDQQGRFLGSLHRLVDHEFLSRAIRGVTSFDETYQREEVIRSVTSYLVDRQLPPGIVEARLDLAVDPNVCAGGFVSITIWIPPATLRVSIIQNISDETLPISSIISRTVARDGIDEWTSQDEEAAIVSAHWALGVLAPGEALVVPRRLQLPGYLTPRQVAAQLARTQGSPLRLNVANRTFMSFEDTEGPSEAEQDPSAARGLTILSGQIAPARSGQFYTDPDPVTRYVVGPSIEGIAIAINGVEFPLRDDGGRTLAVRAGYEFGSCPFVYASAYGSEVMLNRGSILNNRIRAQSEGTETLYLGPSVGRIEIREIERETSHIDSVRLIVRNRDGDDRAYLPSEPRLARQDGLRTVLQQGDAIELRFPDYTPHPDDVAVFLQATGFYVPLPASPSEMAALSRAGFR
jgi:hypothetical protein